MAWRPIYLGRNAVFCVKEDKCIPSIGKAGVDTLEEARAIIRSILRDLKKGYTYDHYGNVREMDYKLAIRRLNFLLLLAKKHGMPHNEYLELIKEVERAKSKVRELAVEGLRAKAEMKEFGEIGRKRRQLSLNL